MQSATAYVETAMELYQSKEDPLVLAEYLEAVTGVLQEIHREVLIQELSTVLHTEVLPAAARKDKVVKLFQLLTCQKIAKQGKGSPE